MPDFESIKRPFTEAELIAKHEDLVTQVGNVKVLREQKAQTNAELNAQIKGAEKAVWDLQRDLSNGYETIDVEVIALMDDPMPGMKTIIVAADSRKLRTEPMTAKEKQSSFGFQE